MSENTWEAANGWWRSLSADQRGVFIQAIYETQGCPPLGQSSGAINDAPQWERGYRIWGYWRYGERIGYVSLSPRGRRPTLYTWGVGVQDMGICLSLREAKQCVEQFFSEGVTV
jgi:hypothetical protein